MENVRVEYLGEGAEDGSYDIVNVFRAMGYVLTGEDNDEQTRIHGMEFARFDMRVDRVNPPSADPNQIPKTA